MEVIMNVVIATSLTTLVILALKTALKNKISPKWQFALWLVIALRLLFPVLPQSRVSVFNAVPQVKNIEVSEGAQGSVLAENKTYITGNIVVGESKKEFTLKRAVVDNALVIWISGSAVMLLYILTVYLIYHRKTRKLELADDEEIYQVLNECREKLGINTSVKVRMGGDTPLLKGIFNPEIILPEGYTKEELKSVFMHELMHCKHRDVLWNILSTLLLCVYWFNPIIWYGFSLFRRDLEILCDYRVLEVYDNRKLYASVLLKTAIGKNKILLCTTSMKNDEKDISKRIRYIAFFKKPGVLWSSIGAAIAIIIGVIFLTNPLGKTLDSFNGLDYKKLYEYRTPYVGDASKVGNLTRSLYYGEYRKGISLKTDSMPYGLTVNYSIKPEEISENGAVVVTDKMLKNAAIIFCLVDNVDNITFSFDTSRGVFGFSFERNILEGVFERDVREYSKSFESFKNEFLPRLEKEKWGDLRKPGGIFDKSIPEKVERNLEIIMSSPSQASNPGAYIEAHQREFQNIIKMGDDALNYMLSQFKNGEAKGLKAHIMMELCKDILGDRNNVKEGSYTSPEEWYKKLSPYKAEKLPPFKYTKGDATEKMVYSAALNKYSRGGDDTLTIVAPRIFGTYEKGNELKIFTTVYFSNYKLYDKTLSEDSGGVVPAAIVYIKNNDGTYTLKEYIEAKDGSEFTKSIRDFCKPKNDIADEILKHYGNYEDLFKMMKDNLTDYIKENNMNGINF